MSELGRRERVDAIIIQTAGSKQRQAIEVDEEGQVSGQTTPSKDKDARWTKKNGLYKLGYKQHTRTDEEGYIDKLHITPANTHECNHLSPLLEGIADGTTVYADKGYDSAENRQHLKEHRLLDGIMRKAHRNRPLTEAQTKRNWYLSKTRYVVEQSFGTLHRKFRYARAAYFGLLKVSAKPSEGDVFGDHGLCGLLEEGAHGKSPKCLDGNLGDFGEFCKGLPWCLFR